MPAAGVDVDLRDPDVAMGMRFADRAGGGVRAGPALARGDDGVMVFERHALAGRHGADALNWHRERYDGDDEGADRAFQHGAIVTDCLETRAAITLREGYRR